MKLRKKCGAEEFAGSVVMAFAKFAGEGQSSLAVARSGGASHLQQLVGDAGHRADYHDRSLRKPVTNDRRNTLDGLGVTDGGAAEFHDDAAIWHCFLLEVYMEQKR